MEFKLPWLHSRKKLFLLITVDNLIFFVLINQFWKIVNINYSYIYSFILLFSVILVNYILGRYSYSERLKSASKTNLIGGFISFIILTIIFTLFFFIIERTTLYYILFNQIIFLFLQQFISFVLHKFLQRNFFESKFINNWIVIGTEDQFKTLLKQINISNLKFELNIFRFDNNVINQISKENYKNGFIIVDPENFDKDHKDILFSKYGENIRILDVLSWSEIYLQRFPIDFLTGSQLFFKNFLIYNNNSIQYRIKRTFDVLVSLILIFFTSPLILICFILIKFEDNGPFLHKQTRTGFKNKTFVIYKLRTMKVNAERNGIKWSKKNDNRITFIGNFLRRTRIDELPQLFSVLNSDMSLIGPRPERPEIDSYLRANIKDYDFRYNIKPGLSGWAQVNYPYGASLEDSRNKLSYDLYYMKNFNVLIDFLIFFKTLRIVFNAKGAIASN